MVWYQVFDSAFWLTIAGILAGVIGVVINGCLKSRCKEVSFCGIKVERDTEAEDREALAVPRSVELVNQAV